VGGSGIFSTPFYINCEFYRSRGTTKRIRSANNQLFSSSNFLHGTLARKMFQIPTERRKEKESNPANKKKVLFSFAITMKNKLRLDPQNWILDSYLYGSLALHLLFFCPLCKWPLSALSNSSCLSFPPK
jgi:hypothetical protein